jgi:hypothetical protein
LHAARVDVEPKRAEESDEVEKVMEKEAHSG